MTTQTTTQVENVYANQIGYSDVQPFEVVRVVSSQTMEIRRMNVEADPTWVREFVPGGFFGHTVNNRDQRWNITSDVHGSVFRIRLQKNGQWKDKNGNRYKIESTPRNFYDYNF